MEIQRHHAIMFEGDRINGLQHVQTHVKENLQIETDGNPDIVVLEQDRFTIGDARNLNQRASQAPLGSTQVFIIVAESILHEAQNALLKLFEEPAPNTYFYLVLPNQQRLLPTVRSRMLYGGKIHHELSEYEFAKTLLSAPIAERLVLLGPIIKNKDRKKAHELLSALETVLHTHNIKDNAQALKEISHAQRYIGDTSSSVKMLLEHVAILI